MAAVPDARTGRAVSATSAVGSGPTRNANSPDPTWPSIEPADHLTWYSPAPVIETGARRTLRSATSRSTPPSPTMVPSASATSISLVSGSSSDSKVTTTLLGGVSSTSPAAGWLDTSSAWANAAVDSAASRRAANGASTNRGRGKAGLLVRFPFIAPARAGRR